MKKLLTLVLAAVMLAGLTLPATADVTAAGSGAGKNGEGSIEVSVTFADDGVISAVAALAATRLCPACKAAMIPSHMSSEPAAERIFDALDMRPVINAGLHLGEGTGALCLLPLLDMAMSLYDGLVFADIGMEAYTPQV